MKNKTPFRQWPDLFFAMQNSGLFSDKKTIADGIADQPLKELNQLFLSEKENPNFNIEAFIAKHFSYFSTEEPTENTKKPIKEHLEQLWSELSRPKDKQEFSSKIGLPYPYIVPGGRFNEIYYWDSYFTMQGLIPSKRIDIVESMVLNFKWMIEEIGFIPNGNRSYFLSRSQPPFFALMVELLVKHSSHQLSEFIPAIEKEYQFWTDESKIHTNHQVFVKDYALARYYDQWPEPRDESYTEDVELAKNFKGNQEELFLHIRSACESGWDFSSRWFKDESKLETINCADIISIDLNCLLAGYEKLLADYFQSIDEEKAAFYHFKFYLRKTAIQDLFFDKKTGFFHDLTLAGEPIANRKTLAGVYPLFLNLATQKQADSCAEIIEKEFLKKGGVVTTTINSGQQWDAPNGWAPLQWVTVIGLLNYNKNQLAKTIAERWISLNQQVYDRTGKMMEKYNVEDLSLLAGGGEYEGQSGFGWTNGVYLGLKNLLDNEKE